MARAYVGTTPYKAENNTPIIQEKEFNPTFSEYSSKNRKQITASVGVDLDLVPSFTLYEVPEGFSFFLTGLQMQLVTTASASSLNSCYLIKNLDSSGTRNSNIISIIYLYPSQTQGVSQSFTMPLKFSTGEKILFITSGSNSVASAVVIGFLEPTPSS